MKNLVIALAVLGAAQAKADVWKHEFLNLLDQYKSTCEKAADGSCVILVPVAPPTWNEDCERDSQGNCKEDRTKEKKALQKLGALAAAVDTELRMTAEDIQAGRLDDATVCFRIRDIRRAANAVYYYLSVNDSSDPNWETDFRNYLPGDDVVVTTALLMKDTAETMVSKSAYCGAQPQTGFLSKEDTVLHMEGTVVGSVRDRSDYLVRYSDYMLRAMDDGQ